VTGVGGHGHNHHLDHDHDESDRPSEEGERRIEETIWAVDNVELTTVGIDVGSATSHLMFSHLHLRRRAEGYSSRFVVVERRPLYRSDIWLTPYESSGLIDAAALKRHFAVAYREAGLAREAVDAGAVILTGVALERDNARRIAELFAEEGGRFVCASAGNSLEALLAAHGSGAVARSAAGEAVLNIDVGGGTTKLALCRDGRIGATMAIWGGARLLVLNTGGWVERAEPAILEVASSLGLSVAVGSWPTPAVLDRLADAIATRIVEAAQGRLHGLEPLAGALPGDIRYDRVVVSGGVAEYLRASTGGADFGDLGVRLAGALRRRWDAFGVPVEVAPESIRATVIGASQFSLQLSGNTIHLSGPIELPIHNVPVVTLDLNGTAMDAGPAGIADTIERRAAELDLTNREDAVAVAIDWRGEPRYPTLRAIADGVVSAHRRSRRAAAPLIIVLDADVGASMGAIIRDELGVTAGIMAIDGVELSDLDFIDVGEHILPANVVPVVIKSLVFPHDTAERPRILGSA